MQVQSVDEFFELRAMMPQDRPHYDALRLAARDFARAIEAHCPRCPDRSAAVRMVRNTLSIAYDAITLKGKSE